MTREEFRGALSDIDEGGRLSHSEEARKAEILLLEHDKEQRAEIARLQTINESWRNITQEEMCYTMMEVEALGIDFKKSVVDDGRALWDVCIERIKELRKAEQQSARLREALKSVIHTWDAYLSNPTGYPAYNKAKDALKETP